MDLCGRFACDILGIKNRLVIWGVVRKTVEYAKGVTKVVTPIFMQGLPQGTELFGLTERTYGFNPYRSAPLVSVRQIGICSYSLVAASMATERILSLKSVGMFPIMRLSQSESAKQSAAYKNW